MSSNRDVIIIFVIYDQFAVIQEPDSRRMVYKTCNIINSNLSSYKTWKQLSYYCFE